MALRRRLSVRVSSAVTALLVVCVYGYLTTHQHETNALQTHATALQTHTPDDKALQTHTSDNTAVKIPTRHLLNYYSNGYHGDTNYSAFERLSNGENVSGCRQPLQPPAVYEGDSCQYVREECAGQTVLINYLSFIMCDMGDLKVHVYTSCTCRTLCTWQCIKVIHVGCITVT